MEISPTAQDPNQNPYTWKEALDKSSTSTLLEVDAFSQNHASNWGRHFWKSEYSSRCTECTAAFKNHPKKSTRSIILKYLKTKWTKTGCWGWAIHGHPWQVSSFVWVDRWTRVSSPSWSTSRKLRTSWGPSWRPSTPPGRLGRGGCWGYVFLFGGVWEFWDLGILMGLRGFMRLMGLGCWFLMGLWGFDGFGILGSWHFWWVYGVLMGLGVFDWFWDVLGFWQVTLPCCRW